MLLVNYFIAGEKLLAFNPKCGSSTLVREIIRKYYPDVEKLISEAHYPPGKSADTRQHHHRLPSRVNPDRPVVQVVREPVDRFASSMAQVGLSDVDQVLEELRTEKTTFGHYGTLAANIHFFEQARFRGEIEFFRFNDQMEDAAAALGLRTPLPRIHRSTSKPSLTPKQAAAVRDWYADDVVLWESLQ